MRHQKEHDKITASYKAGSVNNPTLEILNV